MCFSASASFGAGAALTVLGVLSLRKSESRSHIMFASIPLLFAAQQFTEGFVWLSFINPKFAGLNVLGDIHFYGLCTNCLAGLGALVHLFSRNQSHGAKSFSSYLRLLG
jgi:hypothetical protein